MMTKTEAERLAQAVNALRPSWPVPSLMTFLAKNKTLPHRDVALQLVFVALDESTKTPARILEDGPWKRILNTGEAVQRVKQIGPTDCVICFQPKHLHATPAYADHEFRSKVDMARNPQPPTTPTSGAEVSA